MMIFVCRGPSLLTYLDQLPEISRQADGPVRMPVVDRYKVSAVIRSVKQVKLNHQNPFMMILFIPAIVLQHCDGVHLGELRRIFFFACLL